MSEELHEANAYAISHGEVIVHRCSGNNARITVECDHGSLSVVLDSDVARRLFRELYEKWGPP